MIAKQTAKKKKKKKKKKKRSLLRCYQSKNLELYK